jgi:hypothetical protein
MGRGATAAAWRGVGEPIRVTANATAAAAITTATSSTRRPWPGRRLPEDASGTGGFGDTCLMLTSASAAPQQIGAAACGRDGSVASRRYLLMAGAYGGFSAPAGQPSQIALNPVVSVCSE